MNRSPAAARFAAVVLPLVLAFPALANEGRAQLPVLGLGYEYDVGGEREEFLLPDPIEAPSIAPDHPLYVRVRAAWSLLEPQAGTYDWSEVDRIVEPYRSARFEVTLCLYGPNTAIDPSGAVPSPDQSAVLKSWLDFARAAALHFKGRVRFYEVWDRPNRAPGWPIERVAEYAYVLKNTSVVIRSFDPRALVAQGALALGSDTLDADLAWQKALYGQGTATYVDVLPVRPPPAVPVGKVVSRTYDLLLENDPSAQLWAVGLALEGSSDRERAADLLGKFIAAQGEGAAVVNFDLEADVDGQPEFPGVLLDIHKLFLPTYARGSGASASFASADEKDKRPLEVVTAYAFFDADAFHV